MNDNDCLVQIAAAAIPQQLLQHTHSGNRSHLFRSQPNEPQTVNVAYVFSSRVDSHFYMCTVWCALVSNPACKHDDKGLCQLFKEKRQVKPFELRKLVRVGALSTTR